MRLEEPTSGRILFDGRDITQLSARRLRPIRREMQIIFQDPFSSLNPRMTALDIVGEALTAHGLASRRDVERRVIELLAKVGLPGAWINRYPHEFSGGQRQRIGVARAIALNPRLIVCDEAVSALDVSIQAQVLNLLIDLREELHLSYLFIAHDLSVVKHISNRIAVMYLGQIVEFASRDSLFAAPAHPYTRALLSAIPVPDPARQARRMVLEGDVPSPLNPPSGCRFHTRCPAVMDRCRREEPPAYDLGGGHFSKCFLAENLAGRSDWSAQVTHPASGALR
ncbi:MAG: Oligopeptide transport ATP-binding protein OppF [candidate division BRC1 bacterium ADurb.BinA364]|nr:MAG: Oligopeptide transport ATP-binding protein OppF [candidate division BRC1 bacterium ADurb.BinA364]